MKLLRPHAFRCCKSRRRVALCVALGVSTLYAQNTQILPPVKPPDQPESSGKIAAASDKSPDTAQEPTPAPAENQFPPKPLDPNAPDAAAVGGIMPLIVPEIPQNDGVTPIFPDIGQDPQLAQLTTLTAPDPEPVEESPAEEALPASENVSLFFQDTWAVQPGVPQLTLAQASPLGSSLGSFSEMPGLAMLNMGTPVSDKGLSLSFTLNNVFDTNVFRTPDTLGGAVSDVVTTAGLGATYQSVAKSTWTLSAQYNGGYTCYWDNDVLNAPFHSAGGTLHFNGVRLQASLQTNLSAARGANREIGQVVDQFNYSSALRTRYTISKKTSIDASLSYDLNDVSGAFENQRDNFITQTSAVWHYSPLTEIGMGLRYSYQTASNDLTRSAFGPSLSLNYRLSQLISLRSQVAMEFATLNGTDSQTGVDVNVGLRYSPSSLWSTTLDLRRSTQPQLGAGNLFSTVTGIRLGYNRRISLNTFSAGLGYEMSEFTTVGAQSSNDWDFFTFDASLSRPLFEDKLSGTLFIRYAEQSGNTNNSFDSLQLGFGLRHLF